jgi:hypothetical protein
MVYLEFWFVVSVRWMKYWFVSLLFSIDGRLPLHHPRSWWMVPLWWVAPPRFFYPTLAHVALLWLHWYSRVPWSPVPSVRTGALQGPCEHSDSPHWLDYDSLVYHGSGRRRQRHPHLTAAHSGWADRRPKLCSPPRGWVARERWAARGESGSNRRLATRGGAPAKIDPPGGWGTWGDRGHVRCGGQLDCPCWETFKEPASLS